MTSLNLRRLPRISYYEPEDPSFDEYIFCSGCRDYVYDYCTTHGPLLVVPDTKVPTKTNLPSNVPRAALTIPNVFLHIAESNIPGAGLGVFASLTLPNGVRFGPYRGEVKRNIESNYCWQIFNRNNKPSHVVDGRDFQRSNWLRYVNCSRYWEEQNLLAFQYKGQIYYRTIKIIPRFTELLVFYGSESASYLGVDLRFYNSSQREHELTNTTCEILNKKSSTLLPDCSTDKNKEENPTIEMNNTRLEHALDNETKTVKELPKKLTISKINKVIKTDTKNASESMQKTQNIFECDDCGEKFATKDVLIKHILDVDNKNNNARYQTPIVEGKPKSGNEILHCDICDYETTQKPSIHLHFKLDENKNIHSCQICDYKSVRKSSLERHIRTHTEEKSFSCHMCEYKCVSKGNLKTHLRTHTGEKPFSCHMCEYKCAQKVHLKTHIRTHTGEKPFSCHMCEYKCAHKVSLKTHIITHTGEKPFSCHMCEYKCAHKVSLKTHIRTHTGEKPFSCHICEYKCAHKVSLKTHIRTHTGEKPFSCHICEYKCAHKINLKTHIRTHTGEKPFSCHMCEYKCAQKSTLKRHTRTHRK